jgi:hypothetical protein
VAHGKADRGGTVAVPEVPTPRIGPDEPVVKSWHSRIPRWLFWAADKLTPAIVAVLGLAFLVAPGLKPKEPPPPPSTLGANLSDVRLEERTVRDGKPVLLISYNVEFAAYKGHTGSIEWVAFDAATLQRYDLGTDQDNAALPNQDGGQVIAEAPTDRASGQIQVPVPLKAQCIFVRVYIAEPKKASSSTRLDYEDTAPFDTHDRANPSCAGLEASLTPTS